VCDLLNSNKISQKFYIFVYNTNYASSFSVWNTIMGSSLLTMPWGVQNAGLLMGIITIVMMGGLCLYTTHKLLQVQMKHGKSERSSYELTQQHSAAWNKLLFGLYET